MHDKKNIYARITFVRLGSVFSPPFIFQLREFSFSLGDLSAGQQMSAGRACVNIPAPPTERARALRYPSALLLSAATKEKNKREPSPIIWSSARAELSILGDWGCYLADSLVPRCTYCILVVSTAYVSLTHVGPARDVCLRVFSNLLTRPKIEQGMTTDRIIERINSLF